MRTWAAAVAALVFLGCGEDPATQAVDADSDDAVGADVVADAPDPMDLSTDGPADSDAPEPDADPAPFDDHTISSFGDAAELLAYGASDGDVTRIKFTITSFHQPSGPVFFPDPHFYGMSGKDGQYFEGPDPPTCTFETLHVHESQILRSIRDFE